MKQLFFLVAFATLSSLVTAQSTDEAAISNVLNGLRADFDKRDFNAFASAFVQTPELLYQITPKEGPVGLIYAQGFDNMSKMVGDYMKSLPPSKNPKHTVLNSKIHLNGNSAYVANGLVDEDNGVRSYSRDFIMLEKNFSNIWKIISFIGAECDESKTVEVK